jgi:hypothetical protein
VDWLLKWRAEFPAIKSLNFLQDYPCHKHQPLTTVDWAGDKIQTRGRWYSMKSNLPNFEKAYVPKEKLDNYLLSETHAVGRTKARYFQSIGYTAENADDLADALVMIAKSEGVCQKLTSEFGTKYVIDGELVTPVGSKVQIGTVWVIDSQDARPRFVTAYPA